MVNIHAIDEPWLDPKVMIWFIRHCFCSFQAWCSWSWNALDVSWTVTGSEQSHPKSSSEFNIFKSKSKKNTRSSNRNVIKNRTRCRRLVVTPGKWKEVDSGKDLGPNGVGRRGFWDMTLSAPKRHFWREFPGRDYKHVYKTWKPHRILLWFNQMLIQHSAINPITFHEAFRSRCCSCPICAEVCISCTPSVTEATEPGTSKRLSLGHGMLFSNYLTWWQWFGHEICFQQKKHLQINVWFSMVVLVVWLRLRC